MPNSLCKFNCCKPFCYNCVTQVNGEDNKKERFIAKKEATRANRLTHKIVLLGTGESGKSTFLKQMRIIARKSFSAAETEIYKSFIYDNTYKGVLYLIQARSTLGITWESERGSSAAERLEEHFCRTRAQRRERTLLAGGVPAWSEEEFLGLAPLFQIIWSDASIRAAFDQRSRLITEDFSENTRYYLNRLHHIATRVSPSQSFCDLLRDPPPSKYYALAVTVKEEASFLVTTVVVMPCSVFCLFTQNYVPTNEDIVWSRRPTDSIVEEEICIHGTPLLFVDVGGQTKERRKWCQTLTDMTSILFLVGSSHYDELYVDRVTCEYRNKLREAMAVFEGLINFESFRRISIIIFFNKFDLLKEKIEARASGIRAHFPEFPSDADEFDLVAVQDFLVNSFAALVDPIVFPYEAEPASASSMTARSRLRWFQRWNQHRRAEADRDVPLSAPSRGAASSGGVPRRRTIYRHFTTAVDRNNIHMVFNAMHDTILQNNLRRLMMS